MKGIFSTLHAIARREYLPHTSVTVIGHLSLVQHDWQKADNICDKFKQEHILSSVNYID